MFTFAKPFVALILAGSTALSALSLPTPAYAGEGGVPEDVTSINISDNAKPAKTRSPKKRDSNAEAMKLMMDYRTTVTKPKISIFALGGSLVGDAACSVLWCLTRPFGTEMHYEPGDVTRQTWRALNGKTNTPNTKKTEKRKAKAEKKAKADKKTEAQKQTKGARKAAPTPGSVRANRQMREYAQNHMGVRVSGERLNDR
ncbi:MAG: hypothetical protein AAGF59_10720 [Pseudomonadota bacterium]